LDRTIDSPQAGKNAGHRTAPVIADPTDTTGKSESRTFPAPQTKPVEKSVMTREQILALLGAVEDVHDLCLLHIGMLRHASIKTTGDVYVQTIEQSFLQAVNSRTTAVLEGWAAPVGQLGLKGRNVKGLEVIRRRRERKCL